MKDEDRYKVRTTIDGEDFMNDLSFTQLKELVSGRLALLAHFDKHHLKKGELWSLNNMIRQIKKEAEMEFFTFAKGLYNDGEGRSYSKTVMDKIKNLVTTRRIAKKWLSKEGMKRVKIKGG